MDLRLIRDREAGFKSRATDPHGGPVTQVGQHGGRVRPVDIDLATAIALASSFLTDPPRGGLLGCSPPHDRCFSWPRTTAEILPGNPRFTAPDEIAHGPGG